MPVRHETILPRRALRQPHPTRAPRGDCAACCMAGLLGWDSIDRVYAELQEGRVEAPSYPTTRQNLYRAQGLGHIDVIVDEVPLFPGYEGQMQWGLPARSMGRGWFHWIRMAVESGHYGIAEVSFAHEAGAPTDHLVLICGTREIWPDGCGAIHEEVLVSCSASHPDGVWVERSEFLGKWGGYNALLARPARAVVEIPSCDVCGPTFVGRCPHLPVSP